MSNIGIYLQDLYPERSIALECAHIQNEIACEGFDVKAIGQKLKALIDRAIRAIKDAIKRIIDRIGFSINQLSIRDTPDIKVSLKACVAFNKMLEYTKTYVGYLDKNVKDFFTLVRIETNSFLNRTGYTHDELKKYENTAREFIKNFQGVDFLKTHSVDEIYPSGNDDAAVLHVRDVQATLKELHQSVLTAKRSIDRKENEQAHVNMLKQYTIDPKRREEAQRAYSQIAGGVALINFIFSAATSMVYRTQQTLSAFVKTTKVEPIPEDKIVSPVLPQLPAHV